MTHTLLLALTFSVGLLSLDASAELIHTDWKTSGDKKAVLDTSTGIEWLKLSETDGKSLTTITSELSSVYTGWRFPTSSEVKQLLFNYNPAMVYEKALSFVAASNSAMDPWRELFGYTGAERASLGAYLKDDGKYGLVGAYREGYPVWYGHGFSTNLTTINGHVTTWGSWFLVSDGGVTLSSINNPELNLNNPNAPVHQQQPAPVPVPAWFGAAGALMLLFGSKRRLYK